MESSRVRDVAGWLIHGIGQVTAEEFYWQDANFNSNLRRGRELLFLIANDEWIPSTTERIDVNRAHLVDTELVLEVDLTQIRHEAFHGESGRAWLPLFVLPQPEDADPVRDLTVTDADGALQSTVRFDHVWHAISAALAEIIASAASTHWPATEQPRPHARRDMQLVLSAAVFRLLSRETRDQDTSASGGNGDAGAVRRKDKDRIGKAREDLKGLLKPYEEQAGKPEAGQKPTPIQRLTTQAAYLLDAFSGTVIVAVTAERSMPSTVFVVSAPTRKLEPDRNDGTTSPADWFSRLRPHAELRVDLLLPSANADRYVEVNLPDGVSFTDASREGLAIKTKRPRSAAMLSDLMQQIEKYSSATAEVLCLADLAHAKATDLSHTLSRYQAVPEEVSDADLHRPVENDDEVKKVKAEVATLRDDLARLTDSTTPDDESLANLKETWGNCGRLGLSGGTRRETRTSRATGSARTLIGVAHADHSASDQTEPVYARVVVPVQAAEARFVSIARLSGMMSAAMMVVVFLFLLSAQSFDLGDKLTFPGVGAVGAALTLFAVLQAGRAEMPDRSTLRGYLSAGPGNALIVLSILPSVILVVALAFDLNGWVPVAWAGATLIVQAAFLIGMMPRVMYGSGKGRLPVLETSPAPEHRRAHVLRSAWWRTATANTLVKNRPAFGYVVWREDKDPGRNRPFLGAVLSGGRQLLGLGSAAAPDEQPNNVLSMLRVSFGTRPMTFVVFRDPPGEDWLKQESRHNIHLNLGEQAMLETPPDEVDVFVGYPSKKDNAGAAQALAGLCAIAGKHGLMVLNARMPEPPPGGDANRTWARLRLGLREGQYSALRELLGDMSGNIAGDLSCTQCHILVRTARGGRIRPVHSARDGGGYGPDAPQPPILTSDLDPVEADKAYRVLAMHASAHIGIESEVCAKLAEAGDGMRLVAVTYALLHGTSVFLLLGELNDQRPPHGTDADDAKMTLRQAVAGIGMRVDVDEFCTGDDLGMAEKSPLLRVILRTPDRPGTLLDAIDALTEALADVLPEEENEQTGSDFWHGVLESGATRITTVRLTRQLRGNRETSAVSAGTLRGIEHRTRMGMTRRTAERQAADGCGAGFGAPEDAVVDMRLI